ncbi:MAG: leucine-rich repeat protein [Clostridia bacterium]|nr:leucine-rich repeat protein [Clostridia bacterium]
MKTNKKAISLIVLVITIIVLGILAATVIINLSNTNIIEEASKAAFKADMANYKQAYNLYLAGQYAADPYFDKTRISESDFDTIFGKKYSDKLRIVDGDLAYETLDSEEQEILVELSIKQYLPAGLYQTGTTTLMASWEELLGDTILEGGVIHVDANGVFTTNFDSDYGTNSSNGKLNGDLILSDTVKIIGSNSLEYCYVKKIVLPKSLVEISDMGFQTATIDAIVIPSGITIGQYAFTGATISNITFNKGITNIPGDWFHYSTITNMVLPNSVTSIDSGAFVDASITSITFEGTKEEWNAITKASDMGGSGIVVHCTNGDVEI